MQALRAKEVKRAKKVKNVKSAERTSKRVQLELPPKAYDRLVKLKDETEAATYAEVLKNALRLYEFAVEKSNEGCEFLLKRKDGSIISMPIFGPGL